MTSISDLTEDDCDWLMLYRATFEHERPQALLLMQLAADGDDFVNALLKSVLKTKSETVRQRLFKYVDHVVAKEAAAKP